MSAKGKHRAGGIPRIESLKVRITAPYEMWNSKSDPMTVLLGPNGAGSQRF